MSRAYLGLWFRANRRAGAFDSERQPRNFAESHLPSSSRIRVIWEICGLKFRVSPRASLNYAKRLLPPGHLPYPRACIAPRKKSSLSLDSFPVVSNPLDDIRKTLAAYSIMKKGIGGEGDASEDVASLLRGQVLSQNGPENTQ